MKNYKIILLTLCIIAQECKAPFVEAARPIDRGRPTEVSGEPMDAFGRPLDAAGRLIDAAGGRIVDVTGDVKEKAQKAKTADLVNSLSLAIQARKGQPLTITEKAALSNSIAKAKAPGGSWDAFNAHFDQILQTKEGHTVDKATIDAALEQAEETGTFDNFFNSMDLYFSKAAAPLVEIFRDIADYFSSSSTPVLPSGATGTSKGAVISSPVLEPAPVAEPPAPIIAPAPTPVPTVKSAPAKITLTAEQARTSPVISSTIKFDAATQADPASLSTNLDLQKELITNTLNRSQLRTNGVKLAGEAALALYGLDPAIKNPSIARSNVFDVIKAIRDMTTSNFATFSKLTPGNQAITNNMLQRMGLPKLTATNYSEVISAAKDVLISIKSFAFWYIDTLPPAGIPNEFVN